MVQADKGAEETTEKSGWHYEPGDCVVEHLGEIRLQDGRVFNGAILTFPSGPPDLPITYAWDGAPLRLTPRSNVDRTDEQPAKDSA